MSRKIAIVEDDPDQRENYADAMTMHGFDVTTYPNRREALKGFKNELPDLAILDIMLEDEPDGGFDLCRAQTRPPPPPPVGEPDRFPHARGGHRRSTPAPPPAGRRSGASAVDVPASAPVTRPLPPSLLQATRLGAPSSMSPSNRA